MKDDISRAWSEVSGAPEAIMTKLGAPKVKASDAEKLIQKPLTKIHDDGYHYDRILGGHEHTKMVVGTPKFE